MKVLIADDERLARERLQRMLAGLDGVEVVGMVADGVALCAALETTAAQVVLLDVDMPGRTPGEDGVGLGAWLASLSQPPAVIYVTAHPQHALRAFATHAVDYLLKPVSLERLRAALAAAGRVNRVQAQEREEGEPALARQLTVSQLTVRQGRSVRVVEVDDVLCFEAGDKYVTATLAEGGEVVLDESLAWLEAHVGDGFLRVHRAVLVAARRIERLDRDAEGRHWLTVRGLKRPLEVSRRQLKVVRAWLDAAGHS
ncbi:MAG: LytTR family DNA-binding domain-containing protein [Halothiobacillaceae bacterium]|nr:LytTR family DNA-binding domain-containing protein [Halothiobacillaceae bacterium]